jgi:hypothetical protein
MARRNGKNPRNKPQGSLARDMIELEEQNQILMQEGLMMDIREAQARKAAQKQSNQQSNQEENIEQEDDEVNVF